MFRSTDCNITIPLVPSFLAPAYLLTLARIGYSAMIFAALIFTALISPLGFSTPVFAQQESMPGVALEANSDRIGDIGSGSPTVGESVPSGLPCHLEQVPDSISGRLLIGFASNATLPAELAVIDLTQRRASVVPLTLSPASFAKFSPDGTKIGLTLWKESGKKAITADWDGTNQGQIPGSTGFEFGDWVGNKLLLINPDGPVSIVETNLGQIPTNDATLSAAGLVSSASSSQSSSSLSSIAGPNSASSLSQTPLSSIASSQASLASSQAPSASSQASAKAQNNGTNRSDAEQRGAKGTTLKKGAQKNPTPKPTPPKILSYTLPARVLEGRLSSDATQVLFATSKFWPGTDTCIRTLASNADSCPLSGSMKFTRGRWHPRGELIAYTVGDGATSSVGIFNRASKSKMIVADSGERSFDPVWNPTGEGVAYINESEGKFQIMFQVPGKSAIPIGSCLHHIRLFDWSPSKTIEVEALRVKRAAATTK